MPRTNHWPASLHVCFSVFSCCTVPSFHHWQVCVRPGLLKEAPRCTESYLPKRGDTCTSIMAKHTLTPLTFFALNPGLFCANLFPPAATQDGRKVPQIGAKVRKYYLLKSCKQIIRKFVKCLRKEAD